jgi:hypothetical protein
LEDFSESYFFLYPAGHFGLTAVTFLVVFPLRQIIVDFTTGDFCGVVAGEAEFCASLTRIVGAENPNPLMLK